MYKFYIILIIVLVLFSDCNFDYENKIEYSGVQFSFTANELKSIHRNNIEDAKNIIVTIEDLNGNLIYNRHVIQLFNINNEFLSSPISLNPGNYQLIEFYVMDELDNVLFATPIENSNLSYLISDPLPIVFSIEKDSVIKLYPEVIDTEEMNAEDFGYTTFQVSIVETFDFLISIFIYDKDTQNFILTSAALEIRANGQILYSNNLSEITNQIKIIDGFDNYDFTIKKEGFVTYTINICNTELKSYSVNPLQILLNKEEIQIGEFEFVKLLLECTSNSEGWITVSCLKSEKDWIFAYSLNVEHWNHSNTRIYSIPIDLTENPVLRSTLAYNNHPYTDIFNFRARNAYLFQNDQDIFLAYGGNNVNLGGGYSSVVISSQDSGFTWDRYSIIYQAPDNTKTFIGSVFKMENEYAFYYTLYEYETTNLIEYKYTISSDPVSFDVEGAFPVNDSIMGLNYNTIMQIRNKYLIFYKDKIDNENVILMKESEDLSFADASESKIIMRPGISQYDLYDITPFFYFNEENSELYCMAIVDPRERQDYGFDNDSTICFYKAPVTF